MTEFRDAIQAAGLEAPEHILPGSFRRFPGFGKRNGNTAGWCRLFPDGEGGVFGDWSTGYVETWQRERETPRTEAEQAIFKARVAEARETAEADRIARQAATACSAEVLWKTAIAVTAHPYLTRKGVGAHGLRIADGSLLVPVRDGKTLHSLQFIDKDGGKKFLSGGRVKGCYYGIGSMASTMCIAEGFATAATIHEATGLPVAVAFYAGNLLPVALNLRAKYPDARIVLCADDDIATTGNPGVTAAEEAALEIGGAMVYPEFGSERPSGVTDYNDLAQLRGIEEVKRQLGRLAERSIAAGC
jgi:putative DNA primase/helicase